MSFRLVPKSVTLNDLERRNGRHFALFQRIRVAFVAHCAKVHVRYLISWWVLVFRRFQTRESLDDLHSIHCVSKMSRRLWFAITLTYVNAFWYFLAEMLLIK